jgi:ethanolamine ammonia-lyase large subunit
MGPEYLAGKEIIRAGLEDHFRGKLLGLSLGVDDCDHAEVDRDDMDNLLTLLAAVGVTYIRGRPQTTSCRGTGRPRSAPHTMSATCSA